MMPSFVHVHLKIIQGPDVVDEEEDSAFDVKAEELNDVPIGRLGDLEKRESHSYDIDGDHEETTEEDHLHDEAIEGYIISPVAPTLTPPGDLDTKNRS